MRHFRTRMIVYTTVSEHTEESARTLMNALMAKIEGTGVERPGDLETSIPTSAHVVEAELGDEWTEVDGDDNPVERKT